MTAPTPELPPVTDLEAWQKELAALRVREKTATLELDAIAAQRRRLPMVHLPYGRQEDWQDSPEGWPPFATYDTWRGSEVVAALYGTGAHA